MSLETTKSLREALAHLYYREACNQKGWACVALENINVHENVVGFAKGAHTMSIKLPAQIVAEIKEVSKLGTKGKPYLITLPARLGSTKSSRASWWQIQLR